MDEILKIEMIELENSEVGTELKSKAAEARDLKKSQLINILERNF